ncbi:hypothetical protein FXF69_38330 [Actinomadura chibensis]|uniref:Uncharacterized protein n=1 Tax=Actinomadura chibensis TaxID=392828 RepID=A0A5D0N979_9ACTN|nr:hypothetical protein FXF69_38330 [Actinomadura chibensis]
MERRIFGHDPSWRYARSAERQGSRRWRRRGGRRGRGGGRGLVHPGKLRDGGRGVPDGRGGHDGGVGGRPATRAPDRLPVQAGHRQAAEP